MFFRHFNIDTKEIRNIMNESIHDDAYYSSEHTKKMLKILKIGIDDANTKLLDRIRKVLQPKE